LARKTLGTEKGKGWNRDEEYRVNNDHKVTKRTNNKRTLTAGSKDLTGEFLV